MKRKPNFTIQMSDQEKKYLMHQIELALDDIRPHLATVHVKWMGACESCTMSATTMKAGVEQAVKSRLPQIRSVQAINAFHV